MRALGHLISTLIVFTLIGAALLLLYGVLTGGRTRMPWQTLDLGEPSGPFTGRKLTTLGSDRALCFTVLRRAGIAYTALPPRHAGRDCGYEDGVRFAPGGSRSIAYAPAHPRLSCPIAASLAAWEWQVVQPAARARLGSRVVRINHYGSYNCRRIAGSSGNWSEHAHADAIDIASFTLADGRTVSVSGNWRGAQEKAAFLHEVRDGACTMFATVLSPDYNAAHADHLHLDQAIRGAAGWRACR